MYKVVPRNRGGLLHSWPLLLVILRISNTHFPAEVARFFQTFERNTTFIGDDNAEMLHFQNRKIGHLV